MEYKEYKGYKVEEGRNCIAVSPVVDFCLKHIFECGQCFRWRPSNSAYLGGAYTGSAYSGGAYSEEAYTGVAKGKSVAAVMEGDNTLILIGADFDDFVNIWHDYFDLGTDYSVIKDFLSRDEIMREAISYGWGIRILKQDFFETLISFILSANNRIPMIMKTVEKYCAAYGEIIPGEGGRARGEGGDAHYDGGDVYCEGVDARGEGRDARCEGGDARGEGRDARCEGGDAQCYGGVFKYNFPAPEIFAHLSADELQKHGGGFRCKYITATAGMYCKNPSFLNDLKNCASNESRCILKAFPGVGDKIADCTMLFSGLKSDVFPVDVWVRRIMGKLYLGKKTSDDEIRAFAADKFGIYSGIAQQYLFYYAREKNI